MAKKWYETGLGKIASNPIVSPLGWAAKALTKTYGKYNQGINEQMDALKTMQLPTDMQRINQEAQMRSNVGLSDAAKGLYQQQQGRLQTNAFNQLTGKRALLGGIGNVMAGQQQGALNLAAMDEEARQRNIMNAQQIGMQYGQQALDLQKYKQEGQFNYWMGKKQALNRTIGGVLQGAASLGASALTGGLFAPKK